MAFTTEFLTGLGVSEENASKIFAAHGKDMKKLQDAAVSDKTKIDALQKQVDDADKTMEDLQKNNKDNETLQEQVTQYQKAAETAEKALAKTQLASAVKLALTEAKARSTKAAEALIDFDRVTLKDGVVSGLDEQIKALAKDEATAFLFTEQEKQKTDYTPKGGKNPKADNPFAKETYNLTQQGQMLRDNPEQAKEMASAAGVTI